MRKTEIELGDEERKQLRQIRRRFNDHRSEKALAVLRCASGMSARSVSRLLGRSVIAVQNWLNGYKRKGVKGLERAYSPGRPRTLSAGLRGNLVEWLSKSPRDYGWGEEVWTVKTIIAQHRRETGITLSHDTAGRIIKEQGYSFKRPKKSVPRTAPTKEEKLARIQRIASEILELKATGDVEVLFLDESHFSTEPYVTRGYHKKGEPFFPPDTTKKRKLHDIWGVRNGKRQYLLEKR